MPNHPSFPAKGSDGGKLAARKLHQRAAEEVAEADAEGRQRQAGYVLVGTQRNGQKAVEKTHQQASEQAAQDRDQDARQCAEIAAGCLFIEKGTDDARNGPHIHDARNAEVEVAGLFRQGFAGAAQQQRNALYDGTGDEGNDIEHVQPSFFPGFRK